MAAYRQQIEALLEEFYGQGCVVQMMKIAAKSNWKLDEVMNEALVIAHSNQYDPSRGPRINYLWATLRFKIEGKSRPFESLDKLVDAGFDYEDQEVEESMIPLDVYERDWSDDQELKHLIDKVSQLSGKSTEELARERGCTERNVRYQNEHLGREIQAFLLRRGT